MLPENCTSGLRELRVFKARQNALRSLESGLFGNLTHLQCADISRNRISAVGPGLLSNVPHLRQIDLGSNNITTMSADVWKVLCHTGNVDISSNQIAVLPSFLALQNTSVRSFALYNNPLRCTAENAWMLDWLKSLGPRLVTGLCAPVACGSPPWLRDRDILQLSDADFYRNPNSERIQLIFEVCLSLFSCVNRQSICH